MEYHICMCQAIMNLYGAEHIFIWEPLLHRDS